MRGTVRFLQKAGLLGKLVEEELATHTSHECVGEALVEVRQCDWTVPIPRVLPLGGT